MRVCIGNLSSVALRKLSNYRSRHSSETEKYRRVVLAFRLDCGHALEGVRIVAIRHTRSKKTIIVFTQTHVVNSTPNDTLLTVNLVNLSRNSVAETVHVHRLSSRLEATQKARWLDRMWAFAARLRGAKVRGRTQKAKRSNRQNASRQASIVQTRQGPCAFFLTITKGSE